jgi:hypothetical protein
MRWVVWVALALLVSGCVCRPPPSDVLPLPPTTVKTTATSPDSPAAPITAKGGLESARRNMAAMRPDAVLVGVSGSVEKSGGSTQWEYQFDSLKGKKGYAVEAPSGEIMERPYSFRAGLEGSWVDSDEVASLCKADVGEFSLEVQDGKPVWTAITDGGVCLVDAAKGRVVGGDG